MKTVRMKNLLEKGQGDQPARSGNSSQGKKNTVHANFHTTTLWRHIHNHPKQDVVNYLNQSHLRCAHGPVSKVNHSIRGRTEEPGSHIDTGVAPAICRSEERRVGKE